MVNEVRFVDTINEPLSSPNLTQAENFACRAALVARAADLQHINPGRARALLAMAESFK